jgi:hypothetical protein
VRKTRFGVQSGERTRATARIDTCWAPACLSATAADCELEPAPAESPFIPADAKIVVGAVAPASPDSIPIVLLPGFEYRMREWRHPNTHEIYWRLERRKSGQHGDDDK